MHDAAIGGWWQVDPKAELGYAHSPYNSMQNNTISYSDPDGDWIHILAGAVIGGVINTVTHWDEVQKAGGLFGGGALTALGAFGIGAGAGALTAATGVGVVGAGFLKGAAIGAASGMAGDIALQTGNLLAFNDQFNPTQTLISGGIGGLTGGLTGYLTKIPKGTTSTNGGNATFDLLEGEYREVGKRSINQDWDNMIGSSRKGVDIHHIIPESIYDDFPELAKHFHINDAIQNGIPLPNNWHWKHPAYTKWVKEGLQKISVSQGGFNTSSIGQLR